VRSQSPRQVLDGAGGPGDADVVDQHVQPAQRAVHVVEDEVHVFWHRGIGHARGDLRNLGAQPVERGAIDVAHVHARARFAERTRNGGADARRARGDQHAQAGRGPQ
jgi:hypothetical protein